MHFLCDGYQQKCYLMEIYMWWMVLRSKGPVHRILYQIQFQKHIMSRYCNPQLLKMEGYVNWQCSSEAWLIPHCPTLPLHFIKRCMIKWHLQRIWPSIYKCRWFGKKGWTQHQTKRPYKGILKVLTRNG